MYQVNTEKFCEQIAHRLKTGDISTSVAALLMEDFLSLAVPADRPPPSAVLETKIRKVLLELGCPQNILGYRYLFTAIRLVCEDYTYINNLTRLLYPAVATQYSTTPVRAERAMRHAIDNTFNRMPTEVYIIFFGNTVDTKKSRPTVSEFVAIISDYVKYL